MDIQNTGELKSLLKREQLNYVPHGTKGMFNIFTKENTAQTFRVIEYLRKEEYYYNKYTKSRSLISLVLFSLFRRKKNVVASRLGIYLPRNVVDEGIMIFHYGDIVINDHCRIGKNLKLHGNNCIGNDGVDLEAAPTIGDNVDIGYGAVIIGGISIASNTIIGANAVVINSIDEAGVYVGVPAKKVR